jgi:RsiW-degrading membrane proteinase PrsW (M82 family)
LLVFLLAGCGQHLGGTHDVALDYALDLSVLDPKAPQTAEAWRPYVHQRLGSAEIFADVDAYVDGSTQKIRVTVDADEADFADAMVRWRGGVKIYLVDPTAVFTPQEIAGLTPKRDGDEQYWFGPGPLLKKQVATAPQPADHKVLVQRVDATNYRTRVVSTPEVFDLSLGIQAVDLVDHGRAVELRPNDAAQAMLKQAAANAAGAKLAIVRDTSLLAIVPAEDLAKPSIVISYGTDIMSYSYAKALEQVLLGKPLPPMTRVSATHVQPRWVVAVLCLSLPMVISFAWLLFVRSFDRARPEPWWLVLTTFALGGLGCVPAAFGEGFLFGLRPWLNPTVATLGGQWFSLPLALPVFLVGVGIVEEGSKFLGAWTLARHRREFDEPVDGIVYGCAAALGFAAVENVKYFTDLRLATSVIAARTFTSVPAHMFFGAIWGYALGRKLVRKKTSVVGFFLLAALAHAAFDTFLSLPGGFLVAFLLMAALSFAFIGMLRSSLRFGAVEPKAASDAPQSRDRIALGVGSPLAFFLSGGAMVVCAGILVISGGAYEQANGRASPLFLGFVTALLGLFGLAVYVLSTSLPLDVVLDASGVTFAGGRTPWAKIRGIERRHARGAFGSRGWLTLRTDDGPLRIGPADSTRIEEIARTIESYLGSRSPQGAAAQSAAQAGSG